MVLGNWGTSALTFIIEALILAPRLVCGPVLQVLVLVTFAAHKAASSTPALVLEDALIMGNARPGPEGPCSPKSSYSRCVLDTVVSSGCFFVFGAVFFAHHRQCGTRP